MVATVKFAAVCPAVTVMFGAEAASSGSELVSATAAPPAGAAALSVTAQVAEAPLPPLMTEGLQIRDVTVCAQAPGTTHVHANNARAVAIR